MDDINGRLPHPPDVDLEAVSPTTTETKRKALSQTPPLSKNSSSPHYQQPDLPRLVKRDLPFKQSKNKLRVGHDHGWKIYWLLRYDWFHAFLRLPTTFSLVSLLALWTSMIILFAGIYVGVDRQSPAVSCGLGDANDPIKFGAAFAFSLETCTTVGYGLPSGTNAFFENCRGLQIAIYFQMVWSMMFNAFLFAFFYTRLGRSELRASQVLMADKAIVSIVDGQVRFQIRMVDIDAKHPVVEAHVRLYALSKRRPVPRPLRIIEPDDDLGATILLSFPSVVSHHIDLYSRLYPFNPEYKVPVRSPGLVLRQIDSSATNREEVICPICAEAYGTIERLRTHIRYQQVVEQQEDYPVDGTHLSLSEKFLNELIVPTHNLRALKDHFEQEISEIICVVEGIDPLMSGTFQALQSYRFEDIVWSESARFTPCLNMNGDYLQVNLDAFHGVETPSESKAKLSESGPHDALLVE